MANTTNLDLVKPLGTDHALISVINSNMDKIDAYAGGVNGTMDALQDGLGIIADGDTHIAITAGDYVFVKNNQHSLADGLYKASANVAANGEITSSNMTADTKGGLNDLNSKLTKYREMTTVSESTTGKTVGSYFDVDLPDGYTYNNCSIAFISYKSGGYIYSMVSLSTNSSLTIDAIILSTSKLRIYTTGTSSVNGTVTIGLCKN